MLLVIGTFSWLAIGLRYWKNVQRLGFAVLIILVIYILCCLVSLLVNPHIGYDFFGAPYIRLGAAGLIACVGFGLAVRSVPLERFKTWLYGLICALALVSIVYNWLHFHTLSRVGGVFSQADIFAVFMGCGLLIGTSLLHVYPQCRYYFFTSQALLAILLLLSETRSVLLLVVFLYPLLQQYAQSKWSLRRWALYGVVVLSLLVGVTALLPSRVTSGPYAAQSIKYRFHLQESALRISTDKPLFGYGPGNLADALDCHQLHNPSLQKTCHEGYFFNSSHNIFIDRVLAIGWLGGVCYMLLITIVTVQAFRLKKNVSAELICMLLIVGYYFTNVTSVPLELLLWVLLLRIAQPKRFNHVSA